MDLDLPLRLKREYDRWYPLRDHPEQLRLVAAAKAGLRFPVIPAGRRSGKTERFKRFLAKAFMTGEGERLFAAAPTRDQAKRIFWEDLKLLCFTSQLSRPPSESDLIVFGPRDNELHVIGLDKPERVEGTPWTGGGIDEFGNTKPDAWPMNVRPALDTENPTRVGKRRPWCWLMGVPEGLNHYYDISEKAKHGDPEFDLFHWKSADILSPEAIEAARRAMSARQFRQEYEASFETATGRIYEDISEANITNAEIAPHEQLMWMHDQNFTPLSSAIGVRRLNDFLLLDEIVLTSAISKQAAMEFVEKYKSHQNKTVLLYGDPAGRAGEKHGHASDYTDIEGVLRQNGWTFQRRVKLAAPSIKDRQNSVRAKICTAAGERTLLVNPKTAPWCWKGLNTVQLKDGSSFQEDQKNQYQHITTAIGYCCDYEWPVGNIHESIEVRFAH